MIIERAGIVLAAIEIKYSSAQLINKGFRISIADSQAQKAFVIAKMAESYPIDNKIVVCDMKKFLGKELGNVFG